MSTQHTTPLRQTVRVPYRDPNSKRMVSDREGRDQKKLRAQKLIFPLLWAFVSHTWVPIHRTLNIHPVIQLKGHRGEQSQWVLACDTSPTPG